MLPSVLATLPLGIRAFLRAYFVTGIVCPAPGERVLRLFLAVAGLVIIGVGVYPGRPRSTRQWCAWVAIGLGLLLLALWPSIRWQMIQPLAFCVQP